jgi:hypothetical protein
MIVGGLAVLVASLVALVKSPARAPV